MQPVYQAIDKARPDISNLVMQLRQDGATATAPDIEGVVCSITQSAHQHFTCLLVPQVTVATVAKAVFQLHEAIISVQMPAYSLSMARFASIVALDFTFRAATQVTVTTYDHNI